MKFILLIVLAAIVFLFILFGYVIFKKYLPRKIVIFDVDDRRRIFRPYKTASTWLSVLLPFKPVSATIRVKFVEDGRPHNIPMHLRAVGSKTARLLNAVDLYKETGVYTQGSEKHIQHAIAVSDNGVTTAIHLTSSAVLMDGEHIFRFSRSH